MGKFADGMGPERMARMRSDGLRIFLCLCGLQILTACAWLLGSSMTFNRGAWMAMPGILFTMLLSILIGLCGIIARRPVVLLLGCLPLIAGISFYAIPADPQSHAQRQIFEFAVRAAIPVVLLGCYLFRKAAFRHYCPSGQFHQISIAQILLATAYLAVSLAASKMIVHNDWRFWLGMNVTTMAIGWMIANLALARISASTTMAARIIERPSNS